MKKILGLDLGTNSIGWALVEADFDQKEGRILGMGSRIIPMDAGDMGKFAEGGSVSQTADRTKYRSARKLYERHHQRRERLHRVLNVLGFLPEHYAKEIDFEKGFGQFLEEAEPKLVWKKNGTKDNGKDKFEFLFQEMFQEMLIDFKQHQPGLLNQKNRNGEDAKIPYDWTIYYLRKEALEKAISKEQLAWLILNFNQKRGYYQLRGEEEEEVNDTVKEFVIALTITKVEKGEVDKKNDKRTWYKMILSNGWEYSATFTTEPKWENTEKEFLVVEEYDDYGNIKIIKDKKSDTTGKEKRRITLLPTFDEINLMSKKDQDKIYGKIKARTELTINNSGTTVGTYIYNTLLKNPAQKINGKLVRTIERKFYKEELKQILQKQIELQPELFTDDLYNDCVRELYRSNEAHQQTLSKRDFVHLFLDDIIFYQRPLKSQKSSIGNCSLEYRLHKINKKDNKGNPIKNVFEKDENGKDIEVKEYLKAIPKSNPYYQEFRIWQWLYNLKIYLKGDDKDVTSEFLNSVTDYEKLFEFLMTQKEVNHKDILEHLLTPILKEKYPNAKPKVFIDEQKKEIAKYRWNYVFDDSKEKEEDKSKKYPCNETGYEIKKRLEKVANLPDNFFTREIEQQFWHIIYSVTDKIDFEKALKKFANKHNLDETSFVDNFRKFPPFKSEYGTFSEKVIKKLLPLMRLGKYWNWEAIDEKTKNRIDKILTGEYDEEIKNRVREKAIHLTEQNHFQGLQLWLAQYIVYDRHSEADIAGKWKSVADLEKYLEEFKQHSLRNPIVEQVVTETLRVVKDIWKHYGNGAENFFDEIHIELGREMKNTAEDRKKNTNQITENENTNIRIKLLLAELLNDSEVENVRPHSPMQQEILKIYEDGVLNSGIEIPDYVTEILKKFKENDVKKQPTSTEVTRYKLWLEQKYRSPYTGQPIPLSKLFTSAYEIEHIIPQSRYFDDSFSNKVICESIVNGYPYKDKQLGLEFIKNQGGKVVDELSTNGKIVKIFTKTEYQEFVKEHYNKNRSKRNKLLLEEIPDKMIERQLNDTRYISKFISNVLSNIVRADNDDDGVNSKNIVHGNGKITSTLKQDWGLNDVWNELILPRFERINELTKTEFFTAKNKEGHTIPAIPLELSKGFQKKRIDHRHHALDALVIACATRDHVNLLNNQSAKSDNSRYDLQNKLRNKEKWKDKDRKERDKFTEFKKPWKDFTIDAKNEMEKIVVSFKQNLRVINKTTNRYESYKDENGNIRLGKDGKPKKGFISQSRGDSWAIRKPMHKDTVSGLVDLPRIKVAKGKILTATRKSIDTSFDIKAIESITDTGIQKILKNYLVFKDNNPELAFSPEGLEEMNKNIRQFNDGKAHQPIYKARIFEMGSKFQLGYTGNKKSKYVEAAKGTNLFFAIYGKENGKRSYDTIPLNIVIERQKQGLKSVPEINEVGEKLLFYLSPDDLVYIPKEDERENLNAIDFSNLTKEQIQRIFFVNDFSSSTCYFRPNRIAKAILAKEVDMNYDEKKNKLSGSFDTKTASFEGTQIKEICIKLKVDRLGNISKATQ
jgi:CRISPR-associated endonuclease Csn1